MGYDGVAQLAASVLTLVGVAFVAYRLYVDHERSRRQGAIDLMKWWDGIVTEDTRAAIALGQSLTTPLANSVAAMKAFTISKDDLELVQNYFGPIEGNKHVLDSENGIRIDAQGARRLRWSLMEFLNVHETIFAAYACGIVDDAIIEVQYGYLADEARGYNMLSEFRRAVGVECFPGTSYFMDAIKAKQDEKRSRNPLVRRRRR